MLLRAWRTIGKNPGGEHADQATVKISLALAPGSRTDGVFPWILELEKARAIFGNVVDEITETPVPVDLEMTVKG